RDQQQVRCQAMTPDERADPGPGPKPGRILRCPVPGPAELPRPVLSGQFRHFLPVLRMFCSSVLASSTVWLTFAPCISAFIIVGMTASVVSAIAQFFAFSGEIWVTVAAFANPDSSWLLL